MRFISQAQIPQRVVMEAYPSWDRAPTWRVRLTDHTAYYDDLDLFETDDGIQSIGDLVNHGFTKGAGRLY
jgi:hypothetical protein